MGKWAECWIHNRFEYADEKTYLCCGECWHVYQRPRDLRKAFRKGVLGLDPCLPKRPWFRSTLWGYSWAQAIWIAYTTRAKHIYSCPECAHDF